MNEIVITINLKKNDIFFKDCYESEFLDVLLNSLNSYGIKTEDIQDFRMKQYIELMHSPHVFYGCLSSEEFKTKTQKRKQKKDALTQTPFFVDEAHLEFNKAIFKKGESNDKE